MDEGRLALDALEVVHQRPAQVGHHVEVAGISIRPCEPMACTRW
jgi:hypothetical protein